MNTPLNKRYWKEVSVVKQDDGFAILLDTRPLKTPKKAPFLLPNESLALGVAAEWAAVSGKINPSVMHLTRCANATIDHVSKNAAAVADFLAEYGGTDLLCYRAEAPEKLVERQTAGWDPLLLWVKENHDVNLRVTVGIRHIAQPAKALEKMRALLGQFDPWRLTAMHDLVTICGSLVLALAITKGKISAQEAWNLSRIDENWQAEQWGEDDEAASAAARKCADLHKATDLFFMA